MTRWDDLNNLRGPSDAELRASEKRGAQVAGQKRRIAFLCAKRSKASLTPSEQSELAALLESQSRP